MTNREIGIVEGWWSTRVKSTHPSLRIISREELDLLINDLLKKPRADDVKNGVEAEEDVIAHLVTHDPDLEELFSKYFRLHTMTNQVFKKICDELHPDKRTEFLGLLVKKIGSYQYISNATKGKIIFLFDSVLSLGEASTLQKACPDQIERVNRYRLENIFS